MQSKTSAAQRKLHRAIQHLEDGWTGSADGLFEAKLALLPSLLPKSAMAKRQCPRCGARQAHSKAHDAVFCAACNVWLQGKCSRRDCRWCADRPRKPLANAVNRVATARRRRERVRLPKPLVDAIALRCGRAAKSRTREKLVELIMPLAQLDLSEACPSWLSHKIAGLIGAMYSGVMVTRPRRRLPPNFHFGKNRITWRDRQWLAAQPLVGTPSLSRLRATLTAAGWHPRKLELSGEEEQLVVGCPPRSCATVTVSGEEVQFEVCRPGRPFDLGVRAAERHLITFFRAAGFDVGHTELCVYKIDGRTVKGSTFTRPLDDLVEHGPVAVAP